MLTGWGSPDNFVKTLTIKWLAVYDGEVDDPTSQLWFIMVDKVILLESPFHTGHESLVTIVAVHSAFNLD